jgi:hypothetical protein
MRYSCEGRRSERWPGRDDSRRGLDRDGRRDAGVCRIAERDLGIAAIDDSAFFTHQGRYVIFTNLNSWGWFLLIVGVLRLIAAFSVWSRHGFGRIFGITCASLNAMILLFTVNAYPFAAPRSCCSSSTC